MSLHGGRHAQARDRQRSPALIDDLARELGAPEWAYRCDAADLVALRATSDTIEDELGARPT